MDLTPHEIVVFNWIFGVLGAFFLVMFCVFANDWRSGNYTITNETVKVQGSKKELVKATIYCFCVGLGCIAVAIFQPYTIFG